MICKYWFPIFFSNWIVSWWNNIVQLNYSIAIHNRYGRLPYRRALAANLHWNVIYSQDEKILKTDNMHIHFVCCGGNDKIIVLYANTARTDMVIFCLMYGHKLNMMLNTNFYILYQRYVKCFSCSSFPPILLCDR